MKRLNYEIAVTEPYNISVGKKSLPNQSKKLKIDQENEVCLSAHFFYCVKNNQNFLKNFRRDIKWCYHGPAKMKKI